jgi:hypothetical protein
MLAKTLVMWIALLCAVGAAGEVRSVDGTSVNEKGAPLWILGSLPKSQQSSYRLPIAA